MPSMNISKSIDINAPADQVHAVLTDFKRWPAWSPWLIMDPDTTLNYADDGQSYDWSSDRIGTGGMTIDRVAPQVIHYSLAFLKPWKSKSKVEFHISEEGGVSTVTWKMFGALPFFMFFMKKMMTAFIGMDYERGLLMLKQYVEEGRVDSQLEFLGEQSYPGCDYVAVTRTLPMDRMQEMGDDLKRIEEHFGGQGVFSGESPFCIYHKFDAVKSQVKYTIGVPVSSVPTELPAGMISGAIPQAIVHTVKHTGPYQYLGNVWSAQQNMMRAKEFKAKRGFHPFETYENNPEDTPAEQLVTYVHFAVK